MKINRSLRVAAGIAALAIVATACGGNEERSVTSSAENGSLIVGIKYDQPGLGLRNPDGSFSGFDVEVAKYVADKLGVPADKITFKEAPSAQRETLIQNGEVDYVVATYSITDSRKEKVGFAGPYFVAGQSLLVADGNTDITGPDSLAGKKLCSVTGSTPAQNIADEYPGVQLQPFDTYSACVEALRNGTVDEKLFSDVQSNLKTGLLLGLDTPAKIGEALASYASARGDPDGLSRHVEALGVATPADLAAFARDHLARIGRTIVTLKPRAP